MATLAHADVKAMLEEHRLILESRLDMLTERIELLIHTVVPDPSFAEGCTRVSCRKEKITERVSEINTEFFTLPSAGSLTTAMTTMSSKERSAKNFALTINEIKYGRNALKTTFTGRRSCKEKVKLFMGHFVTEMFVICLIIINAVYVGFETQWLAANPGAGLPVHMMIVDMLFDWIFTLELCLRIFVQGRIFFTFCSRDGFWNLLDFVVGSAGLVDAILLLDHIVSQHDGSELGVGSVRVVRTLRVARFVTNFRIMRLIILFRSLRELIVSILCSLRALAWSLIVLIVMLYVWGIAFTHAAIGHTQPHVQTCWSGLGTSMYTLFKTITSGVDWGDAIKPLSDIHEVWGWLFVIYQSTAIFAVLNVVTSVFCQNAIESAQNDLDTVIFNEMIRRQDLEDRLGSLFCFLDINGDGKLTNREFRECFHNECIKAYFAALQIGPIEPHVFFKLIDVRGCGWIDSNEFVKGCLRFSGAAKAFEVGLVNSGLRAHANDLPNVKEDVQRCKCEKLVSIGSLMKHDIDGDQHFFARDIEAKSCSRIAYTRENSGNSALAV